MDRSRIEIGWPRNEQLESKFNMYERQIDQLFDFVYKDQDDIKTLFKRHDDLSKLLYVILEQIKANCYYTSSK